VLNENTWNSDESISAAGDPYHYEKTASEKLAWEIFDKKLKPLGIDMVALHPAWVTGSALPAFSQIPSDVLEKQKGNTALLNEGLSMVADFFNGKKDSCYAMTIGLVDVQDISQVCIRAYENKNATAPDRYLCSASEMRFIQFCKLLKSMYPEYPIPRKEESAGGKSPAEFTCDTHLAKEKLGIKWKDVKVSIQEMYDSLTKLDFIKPAI
jgi:nucleoside-diphosphate-sugar epimerase